MQRSLAAVGLLAGCGLDPLRQESQAQVPRVGILAFYRSPAMEAFVQGMRDLGYAEGETIVYEWRLAEGDARGCPRWRPSWSISASTDLRPE